MDQLSNSGDDRQTAFCAYCAGATDTRDHVPSRVLLDQPYPTNLPIVFACQPCNRSFSADEEYVACLVACVLAGSTSPSTVAREKVRRILSDKPALAARLENARSCIGGITRFEIEANRIRNVVLKLARGHALFELNEPHPEEPSSLTFSPLPLLDPEARSTFERPPKRELWPEAGSRGMQRLVESGAHSWIQVQPGRYRYLAYVADSVVVRFVLSEYLACEVTWSDAWQAPS